MASVMHVPIMAIGMIMQASHDHRTTGTATCRGGVCVGKQSAISRNGIDIRSFDYGIAVTPQISSQIISNDENDVFFCSRE